jgi:hypothetical protein
VWAQMVQSRALLAEAPGHSTQSTWLVGRPGRLQVEERMHGTLTQLHLHWDVSMHPGRVSANHIPRYGLQRLPSPPMGHLIRGAAASNPLGTSKRCGRMVVRTTFSLLSCTSSITLAAAVLMMLYVVMRHTSRPLRSCREPAHARHSSSPALSDVHDRLHTEASSFPSRAPTAHPLSFPLGRGISLIVVSVA